VIIAWFVDRKQILKIDRGSTLMTLGVLLTAAGHVSTLNVLCNLGLVVVLSSFVVRTYQQWPWMVTGACWLPAFGWVGSRLFVDHVLLMRIVVASLGLVWMCAYFALKSLPETNPQPSASKS
jgi:hypothetical protein